MSCDVMSSVLDKKRPEVIVQVPCGAMLANRVDGEVPSHQQIVRLRRGHLLLYPCPLLSCIRNGSERELVIIARVAFLPRCVSRQVNRVDKNYVQGGAIRFVSKRLCVINGRKIPSVR